MASVPPSYFSPSSTSWNPWMNQTETSVSSFSAPQAPRLVELRPTRRQRHRSHWAPEEESYSGTDAFNCRSIGWQGILRIVNGTSM